MSHEHSCDPTNKCSVCVRITKAEERIAKAEERIAKAEEKIANVKIKVMRIMRSIEDVMDSSKTDGARDHRSRLDTYDP